MFKQFGPAPVPADGLAAALAPFGQSRMLPREAYVDPGVFEWEQRAIFSGWTCVGHADDIAAPGSQRAVGSGANGVLLVRGDDGVVRAFANTCRHRGHELLSCGAQTKRHTIVCPYHAWAYKLDGTLCSAPGFKDAEVSEHVAGLDDVIAPYRPEDLTIVARHSYELATNWKVIAENYQECYHCASIHPELSRISPPTSGENLQLTG